MKKIIFATTFVLGLMVVVTQFHFDTKKSQSRGVASESDFQAAVNYRIHHFSQFLREVQDRKNQNELQIPDAIISQKCSDYRIVEKEVNSLSEVIDLHKNKLRAVDSAKAKLLLASFKKMKEMAQDMLETCHEPVAEEKLTDLRSELMSAGFLYQNLSNPFEISENHSL